VPTRHPHHLAATSPNSADRASAPTSEWVQSSWMTVLP
jgi:hypothetical protein